MKQLSPDDEETIKKSLNELKDKLDLLKQIAIDNNFLDKEDIIDMVDKINETSTHLNKNQKNFQEKQLV